ncbi:hypothetical protein HOY80DRAFT_1003258 [Tuber brumale]|nr:hypothetical protein HOY80DRAFT_1003258 [Tuber brumale]
MGEDPGMGYRPLLKRMLVTSYVAPEGLALDFVHGKGCPNRGKEQRIREGISGVPTRSVSDLKVVVYGVMGMAVCNTKEGCSIDKYKSAGIFFTEENDTDEDSFVPETTQESTSTEVMMESPISYTKEDEMSKLTEEAENLEDGQPMSLIEIDMLEEESSKETKEISITSLSRLDRLEDLIKEMRGELDDLREWKEEVEEK